MLVILDRFFQIFHIKRNLIFFYHMTLSLLKIFYNNFTLLLAYKDQNVVTYNIA